MPLTGPQLQVPGRDQAQPRDALDQACRQVESLFLNELLSAMGKQSFGEGVLGGGAAHEVLEAQRNAALAEEMGRRGELGVARLLYDQLSRGVRSDDGGAQADAADGERARKEETRG